MRNIWKACKIFKVPFDHPIIQKLTLFDLELIDWLSTFDDPRVLEHYQGKFIDDDFEEYDRETREMEEQSYDLNNPSEWKEV